MRPLKRNLIILPLLTSFSIELCLLHSRAKNRRRVWTSIVGIMGVVMACFGRWVRSKVNDSVAKIDPGECRRKNCETTTGFQGSPGSAPLQGSYRRFGRWNVHATYRVRDGE